VKLYNKQIDVEIEKLTCFTSWTTPIRSACTHIRTCTCSTIATRRRTNSYINSIDRSRNSFCWKTLNLRVEHVASVHCDVHVQVLGLLQVPPFKHEGLHTAK